MLLACPLIDGLLDVNHSMDHPVECICCGIHPICHIGRHENREDWGRHFSKHHVHHLWKKEA